MKSISDLNKNLIDALDVVQSTKKKYDELTAATAQAKEYYDQAVTTAVGIRRELNSEMDTLLPSESGRVRVSG
jgi:hypothetical protein